MRCSYCHCVSLLPSKVIKNENICIKQGNNIRQHVIYQVNYWRYGTRTDKKRASYTSPKLYTLRDVY
jgi:hypothetical protein